MTEMIRELTAIKKTNEITSEQVLPWARRVVVQRTQKALTKATKASKERTCTKATYLKEQKQIEKKH